jgi:putative acetyltransferase
LQALRDRGAQGCVLVGSPEFYCRFGFRHIPGLVLEGFPQEYFLGLPNVEAAPRGVVTYHSAFAVQA